MESTERPPHAPRMSCEPMATPARTLERLRRRVERIDWSAVTNELDERGYAVSPSLLTGPECRRLAALYPQDDRFRSTVVMEQHAYGCGEYRYFDRPLPELVETLRARLYPHLAEVARAWADRLRTGASYPEDLESFLSRCHRAGQTRPTPLLLRYEAGGYNRLHQDLYGDVAFPLQAAILLSDPLHDFTGGEFLLTEQRPRTQSRAEIVPLAHGDAVFFANSVRPVRGARGDLRATMRHGVSRVRSGLRLTLGIIFHDAA
jgi:hypothetical protein